MTEPKAPDLTGRTRMNWANAVEAMRRGEYVRRACEMYLRLVEHGGEEAPSIYESGQEGCYLAHAWTVDDKPALVFMGASSNTPFVPEGEHMDAVDWVVVSRNEA